MSISAMRRLGAVLALSVLVLDQLTKWWILADVMNPPTLITVTPFFNLVLGFNTGVSFGMFGGGAEFGRWMLSGLAVAISGALAVWLWRINKPWLAAALGMIIGGAIGNVIDRVRIGAVVDFLDFHAAGYHWPAFNVADMGITIGATILIFDSLFGENEG